MFKSLSNGYTVIDAQYIDILNIITFDFKNSVVYNSHSATYYQINYSTKEAVIMINDSDLYVFGTPIDLKTLNWCLWDYEFDEQTKKWKKLPYSPDNKLLHVNKPDEWCCYTDVAHYEQKGFLLTRDSMLCVIDLDDCRNPETGEIADWAWKIIEALCGYTEVSPSGTGIHIIVYGEKPENARSKFDLDGHKIEVYDSNRYITFTGNVVDFYFLIRNGRDWIQENVPTKTVAPKDTTLGRDLASEVPELELSDNQIVQKLLSFPYREDKFKKLYRGEWEDFYPSQSEGDLSLCSYLAFMTKDEERVDRIFRTSGLYRSKWEREDYRSWTINKALDSNPGLYVPSVSKQMVEDLFSLRLQIRWEKPSLAYVYGALLYMAHKHSGVNDEGIRVFVSSRDIKLLSGLNVSGRYLSSLIHELRDMGLIKILEVGQRGVATNYLIYTKEYVLNDLHKLIIDPTIYPPITTQPVFNDMGTKRVKLNYQKDLNPSQKLTLELLHHNNFSIGELSSVLGMRKDNFKRRVLSGMGEYVKIDEKGFVNLREDIGEVIDNNFDKEKSEAVISNIKEERDDYSNKFLFEPLMRMLEKTGDKKLASKDKAKS